MKRTRIWTIVAACFVVMLGVGATPAKADLSDFYCASSSVCNGNLYAVGVVSHTGNTYVLEVDIKVTSSYTGTLGSDVIDALAIKDFAGSYKNWSLLAAPGGTSNWNLSQLELNANGCVGGDSGGLCVQAKSPSIAPKVNVGVLVWQFQFDSPGPINANAHLKYQYEQYSLSKGKKGITGSWTKVGSLGSWDIPVQKLAVPEASSVVLLLSMLSTVVGCSFWAKRR